MSHSSKFCSKCGSSVNDDSKYCTNCGTEINKEISIRRTTRDEFLNRYRGTKILDHINDIINANMGDRQRLESIHNLIENKQELDYVNFYYLKECSDKYNTINPNNAMPRQSSYASKRIKFPTISRIKIIAIAVIVIMSVIVIGASIGSSNSNHNDKNKDESEKGADLLNQFDHVPSWALSLNPYEILEKCSTLDKTDVDNYWCTSWAKFVLEQKEPKYIQENQPQKTTTSRICKEKEICVYPKEFLKYEIASTDASKITGAVYFDDQINPFTIQSYNIGFGSKTSLWIIDKQDRTMDNAKFSIKKNSFDYIIPIPVKESLETLPVQGGTFSSIQKFTDGEITNETITFGNKQRDVYVFKSHPDPLTKYFEIWEFDSQTGVLMLFKQGGVQNGETWELEEKLTDTNIFDYPTKIDSIKQ